MSDQEATRTTHVDQSIPYEWATFQWGDSTFVAHDVPEGPEVELYIAVSTTRNVRNLAQADAVLYQGNLVHPRFDETIKSVEFCHEYAGTMNSHFVNDWLEQPAVRLSALPQADSAELMDP